MTKNTKNKCIEAVERRAGGRLVDVDDVLMALFNDVECHDRRRWAEVFGHVRAAPPRTDAGTFICRAIAEHVARLPPDNMIADMAPLSALRSGEAPAPTASAAR